MISYFNFHKGNTLIVCRTEVHRKASYKEFNMSPKTDKQCTINRIFAYVLYISVKNYKIMLKCLQLDFFITAVSLYFVGAVR